MPSSTSRFFDIQFPTIPLSGFSADFASKRGVLYAMWVPVVDSCAVTLRSSWDQTSANYVPLMQSTGSLEWTLTRGVGSCAVTLQDVAYPFPFLRIFCGSVAQTAVRTFAVISKTF
jgi:hypothetical protein